MMFNKDKEKKKLESISGLIADTKKTKMERGNGIVEIEVEKLIPGKYQPRRKFDDDALNELAKSIEKQGVMQPIVVRAIEDDKFEIIAGERRWRASQIAGLDKIPAIIKVIDDRTALAMSLIENIQREDLSYLELAESYKKLKDEFNLKNKEVAEQVGKKEPEVSIILGLLKLPDCLTVLLKRGTTSAQILAVLNRCYKLDKEATKKYVANKTAITYKQANTFHKLLKEPKGTEDKDGVGGETKNQSEGNEKTETTEKNEEKPERTKEEESGSGKEQDKESEKQEDKGELKTSSILITILTEGEEWTLDLSHKDEDKEYCKIRKGGETRRIKARTMTVLRIE